jgi:hypothetical protein
VPNYGYLVLIDSNFKDTGISGQRKITGKIFNDETPELELKKQTFSAFKDAFDPDIYNQDFVNNGGCMPPPEIKTLLSVMFSEASADTEYIISKYVPKYMNMFMHSCIGNYLKENEMANIRKDEQKDFTSGTILVYENSYNKYKFVLFKEKLNAGSCSVYTKSDHGDRDVILATLPITSLYCYSRFEPIMQTYRVEGGNILDENEIDTYVISD